MREREVTPEEVALALEEADRREPSVKGRWNAFKQVTPGKAIRVTYLERDESILVITVVRRRRFHGGER